MPGTKCVAVVCALLVPGTAEAGVCRSENLMPEFFAFEMQTKEQTPQNRARLFALEFRKKYPDFYTQQLYGDSTQLSKAALRLFDPHHPEIIPGFAPLTAARFHAVAETLDRDLTIAQKKFLNAFSDFQCDWKISFGPSFLSFDGHTYGDGTLQPHLLFGVDTIAVLHRAEDMPVFLSHELFHVYHARAAGARQPDDALIWWAMWKEGLATYVSQRMNPGLKVQQVLWVPADLVARMQVPGATAQTAKRMLADFDQVGDKAYSRWFEMGKSAEGLPPRAGYYMGWRMARELGKTNSLTALAHMTPVEVRSLVKAFLQRMSRET